MTKSTGKQFIHRYMSLEDRFWLHVNKTSEDNCWNWKGYIATTGYGRLTCNGKAVNVHRISWLIHFGKIPNGLHVLHKCDNRHCVNPNHLFLGTNLDNIADKINKNRQSKGKERPASKLKEDDIVKIRELRNQGLTYTKLSEIFGIATGQLCLIVQKKAWKHV